jgi:hypothetical protein
MTSLTAPVSFLFLHKKEEYNSPRLPLEKVASKASTLSIFLAVTFGIVNVNDLSNGIGLSVLWVFKSYVIRASE